MNRVFTPPPRATGGARVAGGKCAIILRKCEWSGDIPPSACQTSLNTRRCGITGTRISRFALERRARQLPPAAKSRKRGRARGHSALPRSPVTPAGFPEGIVNPRCVLPGARRCHLASQCHGNRRAAGRVLTPAVTRRHRCLRRCAHEPSLVATGRKDDAAAAAEGGPSWSPGARRRSEAAVLLLLLRCFLKAQCGEKTRIQHRGEL